MNIEAVMTRQPKACMAAASLQEIACAMRDEDVGEIPIVDTEGRPIGVITDRDIVIRVIAAGNNPLDTCVGDCMTAPPLTITNDATLEDCAHLMSSQQVRRIPVVDANGVLCGIVALADLERTGARLLKTEVTSAVSVPH